jgi:iron complex transport system permease protein
MRRSLIAYAMGIGLLLVSLVAGISLGSVSVPPAAVVQSVLYRVGLTSAWIPDETVLAIVWTLRLPRVLLAVAVGGGLSIVGVGMQALVRNPLAEPYVLGISSGASAGAALFFLGFIPPVIAKWITMPAAAFVGALVAISIVVAVARGGPVLSVTRLLLAGVAVSAMMAAVTSFVTLASPDADRLRAVLFWLLGSLSFAGWSTVSLPLAASAAGLLVLVGMARSLDALLLGEEPAFNLGVSVEATKRILIVLAALVTGVLVSASGTIGFVGLIVPHAVRSVVGVTHRRLLPLCFIAGAIFLVWADLAARTVIAGAELPVGILTAITGVPFFLLLLRRGHYRFGA